MTHISLDIPTPELLLETLAFFERKGLAVLIDPSSRLKSFPDSRLILKMFNIDEGSLPRKAEEGPSDWAKVIRDLSPDELKLLYFIQQEPVTGKITRTLEKLTGISNVDARLHALRTQVFDHGFHGLHATDFFSIQQEEQGFRYIPGPALLANAVPEPETPLKTVWERFVESLSDDETVLLRVLKNATSGKTKEISAKKLAALLSGKSEAWVVGTFMGLAAHCGPHMGDFFVWKVSTHRGLPSAMVCPGPILAAHPL